MKSIRSKILIMTLVILLLALAAAGGISCYLNYSSTLETLEQTMSETVRVAAQRVSAELGGYKMLVGEIAGDLSEADSIAQEECDEIAQDNGFLHFIVTDASGRAPGGEDLSGSDYFAACRQSGEAAISDPVVDPSSGKLVFMIAAPMERNGSFLGIAAAELDASFLSEIVSSIHIGSGNAAILDKNGTTIAFEDFQTVLDQYNTQQEAKNDSRLNALAAIEAKMCAGESGFGSYYYNGNNKFMAYAPVPDTNGWSIDVAVVRGEFLQSTYISIAWMIVLSVVILLLASIFVLRLANSIAKPVRLCVGRIEHLADGDLHSPVPQVNTKDETGVLAGATSRLVDRLHTMMEDADYLLGEMSGGNFDVHTRAPESYVGDLSGLLQSMRTINTRLTGTLREIDTAADQVSVGSDQVSAGAQALSQGATEQASSVEELAATINEITGQVNRNAESARQANEQTAQVQGETAQSNERMHEMVKAMEEISQSSGEIGKIIKTIEDIAFQTNILALNAAVEAARAGAAGKGFAVVADEVRNLATKSSEASKNTSALIEESLHAVENGTRIAGDTARSLDQVAQGIRDVSSTIAAISSASIEQAESINQVSLGIDQISSVVQTNSATAEQSAAASEELSGQAQTLKSLVGRFQLKTESGGTMTENMV